MNIVVLIPAYNESQTVFSVVKEVCEVVREYRATVLVVNDGSTDDTADKIRFLQHEEKSLHIVSHMINCGVGAAYQTGMEWCRQRNADIVVTFDADGQHSAVDVPSLIDAAIRREGDIINGSRFVKRKTENLKRKNGIPFSRRLGNFIANVITWMLSGIWLTDTQSGMKAFTRLALEKLRLSASKYDVCSEIVREASWYSLRIVEVPISVRYTEYSMSKGQGFSVGLSTVVKLVVRTLMR
jgi:glycosyltransferase involved in cell wall biosynthesis